MRRTVKTDKRRKINERPAKKHQSRYPSFILAGLEGAFPGRSKAIMDVLQPFYYWEPELKAPVPNLKELAAQAIFWKKVQGVSVFRAEQAPLFHSSIHQAISSSLLDSIGEAQIWASDAPSLEFSLRNPLEITFEARFRNFFWAIQSGLPWHSLMIALYYASWYATAGKPKMTAKFKPLFALWLAGNYPLGFTRDGTLLVLVA